MQYSESSVLITGASQGIGRCIAVTFAKHTNRPLLLIARNKNNLEITKKQCIEAGSKSVEIIQCDLSKSSEAEKIVLPDGIAEPGIIINNAGTYLYKTLEETTEAEFQHQVNVNLFSAVNTVQRFLPGLRKKERALIINICSVGALKGLGDSGAYAASKHALLGYSRSLREELKDTVIGVTAINLGQTHSTSWEGSSINTERLIDPVDLAMLLISFTKLSKRTLVEEITLQPQHGRVPSM
ncbi:MAG: SDR family NAD(P)-dependent oxidoreductase [Balneolaceae bacterium]|nr:MAG: SDR family NAD(P)-dependent oxidoreductase [Balneolaceae bacterium]